MKFIKIVSHCLEISHFIFQRDDVSKQELKDKNPKEKKATQEIVAPLRTNKKQPKQGTNSSVIVAPANNEAQPEKEVEEKAVQPILTAPLTNGIIGNPGKEKKKKKSEYNTMQQLSKYWIRIL